MYVFQEIKQRIQSKPTYVVGEVNAEPSIIYPSQEDNFYFDDDINLQLLEDFIDENPTLVLKILNIDSSEASSSKDDEKPSKKLPLKSIKISELAEISKADRVQFLQLDNYEVSGNEIYVVFVIEELYRFDKKNPKEPVVLGQIKEIKQKNPYFIFEFKDPSDIKAKEKDENSPDKEPESKEQNKNENNSDQESISNSESNLITGEYKALIQLLRLFNNNSINFDCFYPPYIAIILNNAQSLEGSKTIADFDAKKDEICYFHPKEFKNFFGFGYDDIIDDAIYFLRIQYREDDRKKEQIIYLNEIFEKMTEYNKKNSNRK